MSCEICKYAKASQLQDDNALTSTLLLAHTLMYNLEAKWLPFCGPAGVSRGKLVAVAGRGWAWWVLPAIQ